MAPPPYHNGTDKPWDAMWSLAVLPRDGQATHEGPRDVLWLVRPMVVRRRTQFFTIAIARMLFLLIPFQTVLFRPKTPLLPPFLSYSNPPTPLGCCFTASSASLLSPAPPLLFSSLLSLAHAHENAQHQHNMRTERSLVGLLTR